MCKWSFKTNRNSVPTTGIEELLGRTDTSGSRRDAEYYVVYATLRPYHSIRPKEIIPYVRRLRPTKRRIKKAGAIKRLKSDDKRTGTRLNTDATRVEAAYVRDLGAAPIRETSGKRHRGKPLRAIFKNRSAVEKRKPKPLRSRTGGSPRPDPVSNSNGTDRS